MKVRQVLYTSQAERPMSQEDCMGILTAAREMNEANDISGQLIYASNGTFLQIIEGPDDAVGSTLEKIRVDKRHAGLTVLYDKLATSRSFPDWSMGFSLVSTED